MLTIIAAMEEELAPARTALGKASVDQPGGVFLSVDFRVIGIGREKVDVNVKDLLRTLRQEPANPESPSELLLLGFAGGLEPSLAPGDLTLAGRYCHLRDLGQRLMRVPDGMSLDEFRRRLMAEAEANDPNLLRRAVLKFERFQQRMTGHWQAKDPSLPSRSVLKSLEPDPGMRQRARDSLNGEGLTAVETDSMTVAQLVGSPDTKRELRRQHQVGTVNMEDYWVARLAAQANIPFLSVRAVLDTASQEVPAYFVGMSGRPGWAALNTVAHAWRIPKTLGVMGQMRQAQASLARFAVAFVKHRREAMSAPPAAAT